MSTRSRRTSAAVKGPVAQLAVVTLVLGSGLLGVTPAAAAAQAAAVPVTASAVVAAAAAVVSVPTRPVVAGSVDPGRARYAAPATALYVNPTKGQDSASGSRTAPLRTVAAALAKAYSGQTIVLRAGVYHQSVTVNRRVIIQAYPGEAVWFDGSVAVGGWKAAAGRWVSSGWTAQFDHSVSYARGTDDLRFLQSDYPMAARPDQVFVAGKQLNQKASASQVSTGSFAVDTGAHTLTVGTSPASTEVRASDLSFAFKVNVPGVVLRGFGVRRYAPSIPTLGTIRFNEAGTIENVMIRDSATTGLSVSGLHNRINRVTVVDSGMIGIHANYADDLEVTRSLVKRNNREHFHPWIAAGGIKVTRSRGLSFRANDISENYATGLWVDESSVRITVARNSLLHNWEAGIELELSDTAVIAGNVVTGGKSGIYLFNTGNVKIFNNAVGGQSDQGILLSQNARRQSNPNDAGHDRRRPIPDATVPWLLRNITVADNVLSYGARDRIYVLDKQTGISADRMLVTVTGNLFAKRDQLLAWGGSSNVITARFASTAAMRAKNAGWRNAEDATNVRFGPLRGTALRYSAMALAMPADVAAAMRVATGTRRVGTG